MASRPGAEWPYAEAPPVPDGHRVVGRIQRVSFGSGSATLDSEARGALANAVEEIRVNFGWTLLVVGLADKGGERGKATALSRSRADTVKRFLEAKGIDGSRVVGMGLGAAYADAEDYEPEGRRADRAAEVWAFDAP